MNIKELAIGIAESVDDGSGEQYFLDPEGWIAGFAEALVAELANENKPVYYLWENKYGDPQQMLSSNSGPHPEYVITALYSLPPTAEQETAEAIATYFGQQPHVEHFGDNIAEAIRSGKWREYL